jgi:hypothetical protein
MLFFSCEEIGEKIGGKELFLAFGKIDYPGNIR